jgi:hypothetical protein
MLCCFVSLACMRMHLLAAAHTAVCPCKIHYPNVTEHMSHHTTPTTSYCCPAHPPTPQVIPCPANGKLPASSRGSSEQTNTQGTCPTNDYVPPSTRTATGSLPARSRSGYSSGSEGQALGPQGTDAATHMDGTADPNQEAPQVCAFSHANRPCTGTERGLRSHTQR